MKKIYKTPLITVEELTKADVLCSSGAEKTDPNVNDNINISGSQSGTFGLGSMINVL